MKISESIYFDHQATTPVPKGVLDQMLPFFNESFGNPHSEDHIFGWKSALAVEKSKQQIADLIGSFPDEIYFTSGATESNNLALIGLVRKVNQRSKRRRFLISEIEHKCVLQSARVISHQFNCPVDFVPVDNRGRVPLKELENLLGNDVLAVSIMAVNNEIGTIQDIKKISELVRNSGALFHCDAAQAPISIDLEKVTEYIDLMSLSAHKMYGPKGIGILYLRRELQDKLEPIIYGGGQQNGVRSGTVPTPLCVGIGAAAELFCSDDIVQKRNKLIQKRDLLIEELCVLPWDIKLNGVEGTLRHPGNANICFKGFIAKDILQVLQPELAASTGSACSSGITETSYVLKAINLPHSEVEASIRFSLGFETTDKDVEMAVDLINRALQKLSSNNS